MPVVPGRPSHGACVVSSERLDCGVSVVSVAGEVDMYTSTLVRSALDTALEEAGVGLVVDLGECDFVDSTALGTLVEANARLIVRGRRLALVAPDQGVRRALQLLGLDRTFAVHDSRASALGGSGA